MTPSTPSWEVGRLVVCAGVERAVTKLYRGRMDVAIALSVVPVIVGLVVLALRLGLPAAYETSMAVAIGVGISLGYALAGQFPGGTLVVDALVRRVAVGLTSAGLIATIPRFT